MSFDNTSSTTSPFDFRSRNFSGTNNINDPLVPDEALIVSYNYYQGRRDRLYLSGIRFRLYKKETF